LQLKLIYIIQLLLQLQLTVTYFSVIFLFQLQLQLTEGTLITKRRYRRRYYSAGYWRCFFCRNIIEQWLPDAGRGSVPAVVDVMWWTVQRRCRATSKHVQPSLTAGQLATCRWSGQLHQQLYVHPLLLRQRVSHVWTAHVELNLSIFFK